MNKISQATVEQKEASDTNHGGNVILHISDLHFIKHTNPRKLAKRQNIQKNLLTTLDNRNPEWKPNIVCITGDISDMNQKKGYQEAEIFIKDLLNVLNIPPENLVICPGNHDIDDKKAQAIPSPKTFQEANEQFEIPISSKHEELFANFTEFCSNLNIPRCQYGDYSSYLFGIRNINRITFLVCNSCWFFRTAVDSTKIRLYIGQPLLEYIESKGALFVKKTGSENTITLIHHPERGLAEEDTIRYGKTGSPPAAAYLAEKSDLVLTGHYHGLPLGKTGFVTTDSLNCGATLQEPFGDNAFGIIKVEDCHGSFISFRLDSTQPINKWSTEGSEDIIYFSEGKRNINNYITRGNSLSALGLAADIMPIVKPIPNNVGHTYTTQDIHEASESLAPRIEIKSSIDEINNLFIEAKKCIDRLEFTKAFEHAIEIETNLKDLEHILPIDRTEFYIDLANIEISRVNWLHLNEGKPKDYTRVKYFYEKAKGANGK